VKGRIKNERDGYSVRKKERNLKGIKVRLLRELDKERKGTETLIENLKWGGNKSNMEGEGTQISWGSSKKGR